MRDYSKISGSFWTGKTGKSLRGDMQTQIVALYLMTSPHANMIGVFNCPIVYIAHETGSTLEGALEGLKKLEEAGFCTYDNDSEMIWVHEMARYQIGDELKVTDNRVKDIQKQFSNLPDCRIKSGFYEKYMMAFHLSKLPENNKPLSSPLQDPAKPETETETETETRAEEKTLSRTSALDVDFEEFWNRYPKKVGKGAALTAWKKHKPRIDDVMFALSWQIESRQWTRDKGQFIPNPQTYINQSRWLDEKPDEDTF